MATHYLNGGSPDYTGFEFNSEIALLTAIKTNLESAGWTTALDDISGNQSLKMQGTDNGDNCWVLFETNNDPSETFGKILTIKGDLLGDGATLSPGISLQFIDTASNLLWLTADAGSGCLAVRSYTGAITSAHYGFLDRPDPALDPTAWMVGHLFYKQDTAYFADLFGYLGNSWKSPYSLANNADQPMFTAGTFDRYTVASSQPSGGGNSWNLAQGHNPAYSAFNGQVNGIDDKPILGDFYYIQGQNGSSPYDDGNDGYNSNFNTPPKLYFRGSVKFAVIGLASISGGVHVTLANSQRYISGGGRGWQGFRIV